MATLYLTQCRSSSSLRRHVDKDLRTDPILKPPNIGFITIFYMDETTQSFHPYALELYFFQKAAS
jgi:hypothetical protein